MPGLVGDERGQMNNIKISTRLSVLLAALVAWMVVIGAIGLVGMSRTNEALDTVYHERMEPVHTLAEVQRLALRNRLEATTALADPRPDVIAKELELMARNSREIDALWKDYSTKPHSTQEAELATV